MGSIPYAVSGITGGLGPYTIRDEKTTVFNAVLCLVSQLCPTLCDTMDRNLPGSSVRGDSPGKTTGVGCHPLLQGIFPTQGLNLALSHCRWILYYLSREKPKNTGAGSLYLLQGDLLDPGIKQGYSALQADSLLAELPGSPSVLNMYHLMHLNTFQNLILITI